MFGSYFLPLLYGNGYPRLALRLSNGQQNRDRVTRRNSVRYNRIDLKQPLNLARRGAFVNHLGLNAANIDADGHHGLVFTGRHTSGLAGRIREPFPGREDLDRGPPHRRIG